MFVTGLQVAVDPSQEDGGESIVLVHQGKLRGGSHGVSCPPVKWSIVIVPTYIKESGVDSNVEVVSNLKAQAHVEIDNCGVRAQ